MTEPNLRWCDFYCFALWLHLGPCHVSIQFVFVCIFGRKRFSTAIQWLPVCVYVCVVCTTALLFYQNVCECVLKLEHIPFSHRIWSKLYLELNSSKHRTHSHIFEIYMRAKKGTEKGTFRFATSRSLWCVSPLLYFVGFRVFRTSSNHMNRMR